MSFLRKLLLVLLAPLFIALLYATAIDVGFVRVGTHPSTIKHILTQSGIYQSLVPGVLENSKQITGVSGDVSLGNPLVKSAAIATFTPKFVQQNTESVIDGVYDWLGAKTPVPDFQIDLGSAKASFASNVAQAAQKQLASLPVCTMSQTEALSGNFDPLSASCLPQGVSASSAASTLQSDIQNGQGFLNNTVITADSIKSGQDNKPIFNNQLKNVPRYYHIAKESPIAMAVLTILVGSAIFFLSSSRRAGLKRIGITMLTIGMVLLVFAWAVNHVTGQILVKKISYSNSMLLQNSLRALVTDIEQAIDKSYWWFGGGYVLLGAAAIGGWMFLKRGSHYKHTGKAVENTEPDLTPLSSPVPAKPEPAASNAAAKAAPQKPKSRRTIKIQ